MAVAGMAVAARMAAAEVVVVARMAAAEVGAAVVLLMEGAAVALVSAAERLAVVPEAWGRRTGEAVRAPTGRHSSSVGSGHSGTLPCLRRGSSSRLVANIRSPATSFWRVSAGSITSSM